MTVPGSNLLTTAFRLVCPEPIRIRKFLRRATNEIGYDVAFYSDPLNTTASVQAVDIRYYTDFGLDFAESHIHIWAPNDVDEVYRLINPDQIDWNNRRWEVISESDWFPIDGWNNFIAVEVPDR